MAADSKLDNIMTIDKVLHEKNLGLLWQTFERRPCRQRPQKLQSIKQTNQFQLRQSTANTTTKLQYLDRKLV